MSLLIINDYSDYSRTTFQPPPEKKSYTLKSTLSHSASIEIWPYAILGYEKNWTLPLKPVYSTPMKVFYGLHVFFSPCRTSLFPRGILRLWKGREESLNSSVRWTRFAARVSERVQTGGSSCGPSWLSVQNWHGGWCTCLNTILLERSGCLQNKSLHCSKDGTNDAKSTNPSCYNSISSLILGTHQCVCWRLNLIFIDVCALHNILSFSFKYTIQTFDLDTKEVTMFLFIDMSQNVRIFFWYPCM